MKKGGTYSGIDQVGPCLVPAARKAEHDCIDANGSRESHPEHHPVHSGDGATERMAGDKHPGGIVSCKRVLHTREDRGRGAEECVLETVVYSDIA
jgi:hypothetical protein